MNKRIEVLVCLMLVINGALSMSGYLFKDTLSPQHHTDSDKVEQEADNSICHLNIQTDLSVKNEHQVFSGNGFKYNIACSVNDPHTKNGDKYYVIDLVVYGPNKRVSKAWHEQYLAANGRSISMNKKLSFYWLGYSSIICSVSKYNKLTNKFTKLCQNNAKVFVKENPIFNKNGNVKKPATIQIAKPKNEVFKPNKIETTTNTTEKEIKVNTTLPTITDNKNLNLTVRAMQYRDLYKASSEKQSAVNDLNIESKRFKNSNRSIIQPVLLGLVFFFIFGLSIGTIAYLSYNQRLTQDYHTVNMKENKTRIDEVCLSKFSKRPKSYACTSENEATQSFTSTQPSTSEEA